MVFGRRSVEDLSEPWEGLKKLPITACLGGMLEVISGTSMEAKSHAKRLAMLRAANSELFGSARAQKESAERLSSLRVDLSPL